MATYTENYDLTLPEAEDVYNVEDMNGNFETVDTLLAEQEAELQGVREGVAEVKEAVTGVSADVAEVKDGVTDISTDVAEVKDGVTGVSDKIGNGDTGETVFSLLKNSGSVIKSFQKLRIIQHYSYGEKNTPLIHSVNPDKCLVVLNKLQDGSYGGAESKYTLYANHITTSYNGGSSQYAVLDFNIVELDI